MDHKSIDIAVIGLGYVGLPLASLLAKKFEVTGFDISKSRIKELGDGIDHTNEVTKEDLKQKTLKFSSNLVDIKNSNFYIVTVPTPIDENKKPDLTAITSATKSIGSLLKKGDIVVFESTVYPGLTEEICVPILESESNLKWITDFNVGYSPERVNPGDKKHTIDKIIKVVSADSEPALKLVKHVYGSIVQAGIHVAPNIKTAEAAKVIENTQRDLNIALMNELSIIFNKLDINTSEVLDAAATKWNFLKFTPGLVGGHCIGVDPYYLTFKAEALGYQPQVILSGRRINDEMSKNIADAAIKGMIKADISPRNSKVLIAGFTFKENVGDIRNTKVIDIYNELLDFEVDIDVYDPVASAEEIKEEYGISTISKLQDRYDCIILAVKHNQFIEEFSLEACYQLLGRRSAPLIDIKNIHPKKDVLEKGLVYFSL